VLRFARTVLEGLSREFAAVRQHGRVSGAPEHPGSPVDPAAILTWRS
jgi:hypothetical protein